MTGHDFNLSLLIYAQPIINLIGQLKVVTLRMLGKSSCFFVIQNQPFSKNSFRSDRPGSDLGPNCLQRLTEDSKKLRLASWQRVNATPPPPPPYTPPPSLLKHIIWMKLPRQQQKQKQKNHAKLLSMQRWGFCLFDLILYVLLTISQL